MNSTKEANQRAVVGLSHSEYFIRDRDRVCRLLARKCNATKEAFLRNANVRVRVCIRLSMCIYICLYINVDKNFLYRTAGALPSALMLVEC